MGATKISSIINNAIEDMVTYRNEEPTKITLSKPMYDRLVGEISVSSKQNIGELVSYLGYPIEVDYSRAIKIIVE